MCMEDIRIGRQSSTNVVRVVTTGFNDQAAPPAPNRTAITFSLTSANDAIVAPQGLDPSTGGGFLLNATRPSVTIKVEDFGHSITGPWQVLTPGGGGVAITVIDVTLERW